MDSEFLPGVPSLHPQGPTVRAEYGDATTTIDPSCANVVAQAFPNTYGQPLVSFVAPADAEAAAVEERAPIRSTSDHPI